MTTTVTPLSLTLGFLAYALLVLAIAAVIAYVQHRRDTGNGLADAAQQTTGDDTNDEARHWLLWGYQMGDWASGYPYDQPKPKPARNRDVYDWREGGL